MTIWELLGVEMGCSNADLASAYRRKCKELHPDITGNDPEKTKLFISMKATYEKVMAKRTTDGIEKPRYVRPESKNNFAGFAGMYFSTQDLYRIYEEMARDGRIGAMSFERFKRTRAGG